MAFSFQCKFWGRILAVMLLSRYYLELWQQKYTVKSRHGHFCSFRFFFFCNRKPSIFLITLKHTKLAHSSKNLLWQIILKKDLTWEQSLELGEQLYIKWAKDSESESECSDQIRDPHKSWFTSFQGLRKQMSHHSYDSEISLCSSTVTNGG